MVISDQVRADYVAMLSAEDKHVWQAKSDWERAEAAYKAAVSKYVAIRDLVTEQLEGSPYDAGHKASEFPSGGSLRFVGMAPGEACAQLLLDRIAVERPEGPTMALAKLTIMLRRGGLTGVDSRTVNAALMATLRETRGSTLGRGQIPRIQHRLLDRGR